MADISAKQLAQAAVRALEDKKGQDILVLDLDGLTTLADYYILCTGQSMPQLRALADAVDETLSRLGVAPRHVEGYPSASWILQDYGSIVVHIFRKDAREFYGLERLWADAPRVDPVTFERK